MGLTPEDTATATAIVTAAAATNNVKQRTAGAAPNAASIAAKAIKFPITIGKNDDDGTTVIEIIQDQLDESTRIQAILGNRLSDLLGKLG